MTSKPTYKDHDELVRELLVAHPELQTDVAVSAKKRALGKALWEHFVHSRLSKAELARRMGTSVASINRLFTAGSHGSCTATTLFKFEVATGSSLFVHEACPSCQRVEDAYVSGLCVAWGDAAIDLDASGLDSIDDEREPMAA